jgi:hypothetical protein
VNWTAYLTPTVGATGLLALVVVLIFRGSLVPRSTVDQMRNDKDEQIKVWREAYEKSSKAGELKDHQINSLLEATKTTNHVVTAMSEAAGLSSGRSRHALAPED